VPNSVLKGALFTVSMRWASRLIGIASTLILARLLVPDDFGVTAMASIIVGLASTLLDVGVNVALIRNPKAEQAHYDSAWTLRLLQAGVVALALVAAAPAAGDYFRDARVAPVMMLMAANVFLASLENIGIVRFQKEMQFGREMRYLLLNRLAGFVFTVVLAFALRSYWALVLATTLGTLFAVVHSYIAHPMRPRPSFQKMRELMSISQWMLVQNIGGFADANLHKLVVGRRDDTATMGAYSVAAEIASLPSTELLQPLNRVLFPAFVAVKHDLAQLKRAFLLAQSIQVMVAVPAAVLLTVMAADLVPVLLGPKWSGAVPLLEILSLGYAVAAIQASAWYVSITLGKEKLCASVAWGQVVLFAALVWIAMPTARGEAIAWSRVGVSCAGLGLQLWIVSRALGHVGIGDLLAGTWRTALALGLVVWLTSLVPWQGLHPLLLLPAKAALFIAAYVLAVWLLWRLASRPDGAERYVADRVSMLTVRWQPARDAAAQPPSQDTPPPQDRGQDR
jgi:lipopolysaccharide exporter